MARRSAFLPIRYLLLLALGTATLSQASPDQAAHLSADRIVVIKSAHTMELLNHGQVLKTYKVALGDPHGSKTQAGDKKTPEGVYAIDAKNPNSLFHRALHLSYPNAADRARARKLGVSPGGDIEIHGLPKQYAWLGAAHRQIDWTTGCIAVTNPEIDEIWNYVSVGTAVEIRP
jgi:murein L,D-transpeptidase YafK